MTDYRLRYRGTLFPIRGGEATLGRSSYASIVVNNPLASREHALVREAPGRLEVTNLGSKNGTFVNGARVEGVCPVHVGDQIRVGTDVIEVSVASAQDPSTLRVATEPGHKSAGSAFLGDEETETGREEERA